MAPKEAPEISFTHLHAPKVSVAEQAEIIVRRLRRSGTVSYTHLDVYKRQIHGREVLERAVEAFGDDVFHTVIRRTIKFPETTVAGEPITSYASSSPGAAAYRQLAREVLVRCPGA